MRRAVTEWLAVFAAGIAIGLGVAWVEDALAIPKIVVQVLWIVVMAAALGFAGWAAWGYYRAVNKEDDWG